MSSGIYKLTFLNGDYYIGKSLDLERRWQQHYDKLTKGTAAKNMMLAFQLSDYEYPQASIVLECHPDVLDEYENVFINDLQPTLNTQRPEPRTPQEREALVRHAKYNRANYSVPVLMITMENLHNQNQELEETIEELEETIEAWEDKALWELRKTEKFKATEQALKISQTESLELLAWKHKVDTATWWQRLWRLW